MHSNTCNTHYKWYYFPTMYHLRSWLQPASEALGLIHYYCFLSQWPLQHSVPGELWSAFPGRKTHNLPVCPHGLSLTSHLQDSQLTVRPKTPQKPLGPHIRAFWNCRRVRKPWRGPLMNGRWERVGNDSPFRAPRKCPELRLRLLFSVFCVSSPLFSSSLHTE